MCSPLLNVFGWGSTHSRHFKWKFDEFTPIKINVFFRCCTWTFYCDKIFLLNYFAVHTILSRFKLLYSAAHNFDIHRLP